MSSAAKTPFPEFGMVDFLIKVLDFEAKSEICLLKNEKVNMLDIMLTVIMNLLKKWILFYLVKYILKK